MEEGVFGYVKSVGGEMFEMRIYYGTGYRIYYTRVGNQIIVLLCGGDKSTQRSDIAKTKKVVEELENA